MKYPIGIQTFRKLREDGYTYVDKTAMVYSITHDGTVYFLSRPRLFGKSLLVSTLKSYFLGEKELFKGLAIERLETEWETYPVFHIDFSGGLFQNADGLDNLIDNYLTAWEKEYGVDKEHNDIGIRFINVIKAAHNQTGKRVVVLVDEYDKPLLDVMESGHTFMHEGQEVSLESYNRETLRALYSTFKAADEHLRFIFLTGVTKFAQVSVFSGFNQPNDISMSEKYDTLCGITEEEMLHYFTPSIEEMAKWRKCSFTEMVEMLKRNYDGYHFSDAMTGLYNPFSLLNAFDHCRIQDYWFSTGTPSYLIRLLNNFDENVNELVGKYYMPSQFVDYRADVERPLPMIYQSGYLTIKDYDADLNFFLLDFPNDEVKRGFVTMLANNYLKPQEQAESWIRQAVIALRTGDTEAFRTQLTAFLASIPYSMRRKENEREKERYFQYTFFLLLRLISTFLVFTEKEQSQGRVDCVVEAPQHIYIFEFKLDGTAEAALRQINEKGYAREYASDSRKVHLIGISFSSETGTISDWQEAIG